MNICTKKTIIGLLSSFLCLNVLTSYAGAENVFEGRLTIKNNSAYTLEITDDRMTPNRGKFTFDPAFLHDKKHINSGKESYIGEGKSKQNKTQGQFTVTRVDTNSTFLLKYRFGERGDDTWVRIEPHSSHCDRWLPKLHVEMLCKKSNVGWTGKKYKHTCTLTFSDSDSDSATDKGLFEDTEVD